MWVCCCNHACRRQPSCYKCGAASLYLVALGGDNLLNDQVVGGLIIHCQDEGGAMGLHVGRLAVCQAAAILHAAGCACTTGQASMNASISQCWYTCMKSMDQSMDQKARDCQNAGE